MSGPTNAVPFTQAQMDAMGVCRVCGGMNGFHEGVRTGSWVHPPAAVDTVSTGIGPVESVGDGLYEWRCLELGCRREATGFQHPDDAMADWVNHRTDNHEAGS